MAVTLQRTGVGSLAYPFYLADYAADLLPVPPDGDATAFVLETRQTYVWRQGAWVLYDDRLAATLLALRQAVDAVPTRYEVLILRELRRITTLLARSQGIPEAALERVPELDDVGI